MFIYIHKYMYKMYYVKVLGNPFDDNFGPFLLNLSWEVTFDIPHEWPPKTGLTVFPLSRKDKKVCICQFDLKK
jgi:hypothetical protein